MVVFEVVMDDDDDVDNKDKMDNDEDANDVNVDDELVLMEHHMD